MLKSIITISLILLGQIVHSQLIDWKTYYEKSAYQATPRYDETIRYCKQLAYNSDYIRYSSFGVSPQGRELPLLIVSTDKLFSPEEARKAGKAVVLIQASIHSGEPDGKDAGMMLLRDMIIEKKGLDKLTNLVVLFIPIFNVDGHEIWSKYSRINQNGPIESGFRATAQNLNLNRDYLKADAPEMQAWLKLYHSWLPDFFIDCHTTDGADYQYEITYGMEIGGNMDEDLTRWQKDEFIPAMEKYMDSKQMPVFPYVQFRKWHDPRSGLRTGVASPMTSTGYTALMNRPGLLIETHMLKQYRNRVSSTYEMILFSLDFINTRATELNSLILHAGRKMAEGKYRRQALPVKYKISMQDSIMVNFKGIDYEVVKSDLTGHSWFKYGNTKKDFLLPYFNKTLPEVTVKLPEAYFIPAELTEIIRRLDDHNIQYYRLGESIYQDFESYSFPSVEWGKKPYEGRIQLNLKEVVPIEELRRVEAGAVVVPVEQSRVKIIAHLLEPQADNSLISWGFMNSVFEQKEYAETYVMEKMAREMIKSDKKLKEEFEQKMASDPDFAGNHWAITNWFYEKTPYYDKRINKYPISKLNRIKKPNYGVKPVGF